jgi:predicted Zn-dependent peptidase
VDAEAQPEAIEVHGQFLARDSALMLELLADAVLRPRFAADEFEKLRTRRIEELKATKDSSPQALLGNYGRALLFAHHAYGQPVGGSEQSLARIRPADVAGYYARQSGADRATLVIAGDFDAAQIRADVTRQFGDWASAPQALPPVHPTARVTGRRVLLVDAPGSTQTYFWLGNVGVSRHYPRRAALEVAASAFGGSFGSMLNQELRVRTGLTYGASARFSRGSVAGEFAIGSFTETGNTERAIELALATLARLRAAGLDRAKIDSARNYLLGQYPLGFETAADWAQALGELDLYGLPESDIGHFGSDLLQVNAAAVRATIADAFPPPNDLDIVMIGDAARIAEVAARLGPVARMTLAAPDYTPPGAAH